MARFVRTRRRFLELAGSGAVVGIAGCLGGGGGQQETETESETEATTEAADDDHDEERPEGVSAEEFERGPVPEPYRTALSQANERRDPDDLFTKEAVKFQEADDAVEAGLTEAGRNCGNCAEYIPDKNGDGFGACAKVEGYIGSEDWCSLWESIEEAEAEAEEGEDGGETASVV
ncbi:high-potential iron-sulfur protein [Haloferax denitrificans]|uniref:high-potential iron-sulfur protein n=1 Tax=Haloferax denitrificans TaxID=35745 RepID=UPI000321E049|nr:high-potential iron-sulfur protein [Haloferax denitrificans]